MEEWGCPTTGLLSPWPLAVARAATSPPAGQYPSRPWVTSCPFPLALPRLPITEARLAKSPGTNGTPSSMDSVSQLKISYIVVEPGFPSSVEHICQRAAATQNRPENRWVQKARSWFWNIGLAASTKWNFIIKAEKNSAKDPRCLKITWKVSFNIASEEIYVYILSGQKLIRNAKNAQLGEFLKTWSLRSNSVTRQVNFLK